MIACSLSKYFTRYKYSNLAELVAACKRNEQRGLACLLAEECIKPRSSNKIGESGGKWDIPRSELIKDKELDESRGLMDLIIKELRDKKVSPGEITDFMLDYVAKWQIPDDIIFLDESFV